MYILYDKVAGMQYLDLRPLPAFSYLVCLERCATKPIKHLFLLLCCMSERVDQVNSLVDKNGVSDVPGKGPGKDGKTSET